MIPEPFEPVTEVANPILPGFYPDPSICRVGTDYYLVNSSFSYFPGVPIFHSTDLAHWNQIGHVLDRPSQLNLTHQGISEGIYAPALRYHDGLFYMITTFVGGGGNFFVTAEDPKCPWSDPIFLPTIEGIDPSFFFDEDGRAYIVNNGPPPNDEPAYEGHRAIWLQEFDLATTQLVGPREIIVNGGTDLTKQPIWIEGPHIFRKDDSYFLIAAEGGTGPDHSEVVFQSASIFGPYEPFSGNPILTQRDLNADRPNPITCAGHADFVQTPSGEWYAVFLACQPNEDGFTFTGRQTFFLPVDWSGGWPIILSPASTIPSFVSIPASVQSDGKTFADASRDWLDTFDDVDLKREWNFIRTPKDRWYEVGDGKLVINAQPDLITERGQPSFLGHRIQHQNSRFETALTLPIVGNIEAGLVAFQNEEYLYQLLVRQSFAGRSLVIASATENLFELPLVPQDQSKTVYLGIEITRSRVQFLYGIDGETWFVVGPEVDGSVLSTEVAGGFVGASFGLYAHSSEPTEVAFHWARYQQIE